MLNEKVVVVTGGSGLLGRRFCEAVAAHGGRPVVADINLEQAQAVAEAIRGSGGESIAVHLDITSEESVRALIAKVNEHYGRIDGVVNNAYPRNARFGRKLEEVVYADFCANIDSHLGGYFLVAQQFAMHFRGAGGGSIVNLGSIYGVIAPRFEVYDDTPMTLPVEYAAIKAAVSHLSRYFAQYYRKSGVRVNTLSPGGIFDHQPEKFLERYNAACGTKGMLDGDDIVGTLVFLLSDASRYVTGQEIIVDDGFAL
jgi:NAD(P)-dependent dehydrogenase (short-subunit alcohol dehydrogenase family)